MTMIRRALSRLGTLRWRLTLFYCLLLAILLMAFSYFVYNRFQEAQKQNTITRLADMALVFQPGPGMSDEVKKAIASGDLVPTDQMVQKFGIQSINQVQQNVQKAGSLDGLYIALLDPQGATIASNQPSPDNLKVIRIDPHLLPVPTTPNTKIGAFEPSIYETTLEETVASKSQEGLHQQSYLESGMAYVLPFWVYDSGGQKSGARPDGYLALVAPIQQDTEALNQLRGYLVYGMIGTLLLALLLGLPLARLGLRPLERIAATADKIGNGDLTSRVDMPSHLATEGVRDEVQQLGRAFNTMLDKIETAFMAQQRSETRTRRFAADASHELRSPLTVLGGYLDVLLMGAKDDPAEAERILRAMKRENDRLSRLVIDLLLLTRIDANGAGVLRMEPVRVEDLVEQASENMQVVAGERDLVISLTPEARSAWVQGDGDHLYRVLANLLDNALRYTPENGQISLSAAVEARAMRIDVRDTGCGIDADQLPRVFDRFYRADASRARQTGNAGLGLAICKSIVEAHGGQITVSSTPGRGTDFLIKLPLLQTPDALPAPAPPAALPQTAVALSKL